MIKFIIGMVFGAFVGAMWMAMCCIVDDIDELASGMEEEPEERCQFCGGKLSEPLLNEEGNWYRHCYGCHFDYEVNE